MKGVNGHGQLVTQKAGRQLKVKGHRERVVGADIREAKTLQGGETVKIDRRKTIQDNGSNEMAGKREWFMSMKYVVNGPMNGSQQQGWERDEVGLKNGSDQERNKKNSG